MEVRRNPKPRLKNKVNSILVFYSNPGRNLPRILTRSYLKILTGSCLGSSQDPTVNPIRIL